MAFTEDLAPFTTDFGITAVVGGETLPGIFDEAYADALGIAGTWPSLLIVSADAPAVTHGSTATIGAASFTVAEVQPDGTGMTRLILETV